MDDVAGGAALLVNPEDTAAIRAAVERLAADGALRFELATLGARNVTRFDAAHVAAAYAELYARIDQKARNSGTGHAPEKVR
jgi:glycosyltransferase involved in cell wall biosynthesis